MVLKWWNYKIKSIKLKNIFRVFNNAIRKSVYIWAAKILAGIYEIIAGQTNELIK